MAHQHPVLSRLLSANAQWASNVNHSEPDFFNHLAQGQSPKVLWIGCADSRVPESIITACKPGDIFVHRNIANQFHLNDDSAQSVLSYAVDQLGVEHVVVVGHTQCGGAAACLSAVQSQSPPQPAAQPISETLSRWLSPLTTLASTIHNRLPTASTSEALLSALVEENVKAQVENVCKASTVVSAWRGAGVGVGARKSLWIHGWVFEIEHGKLRDLGISRGPPVVVNGDAAGVVM